MSSSTIEVVAYSPEWENRFKEFKDMIERALSGIELRVEHVGSTAVKGLWAKPKIDMDVVIPKGSFDAVKTRLEDIGYYHNGDQGIAGREVFKLPNELRAKKFNHALYVCVDGSRELARHIAFRDYLRANPSIRDEYSEVKRKAAEACNNDINLYMNGKGEFVTKQLERAIVLAGIVPEGATKTCPSCGQSIIGKFKIMYVGDGNKREGHSFTCSKCDTDDFVECSE